MVEDAAQKLYRKRNKGLDLSRDVDSYSMWAFFCAIAAPIAGLYSLNTLTLPFSIAAIILSIVGIRNIRSNPKTKKGMGFAVASLFAGIVETFIALIILFFQIGIVANLF